MEPWRSRESRSLHSHACYVSGLWNLSPASRLLYGRGILLNHRSICGKSMKALILIPSCRRDRPTQDYQRLLFLKMPIAHRFFLGCDNTCADGDEVILPVRDDYWALPQKVRAAFRWALDQIE